VDSTNGTITISGSNKIFKINPIPPFMEELIADGGLMKHIAKKRRNNHGYELQSKIRKQ
jgi:3-isopropylmalate/(R)-2-methylmalate dehydratase small subunit